MEVWPHVGSALAGRLLWLLTSIFDRHLAAIWCGGALIANQSTMWSPKGCLGMMRSECKKDRERHYCTCRNQNDRVLSHGTSVYLEWGRF